MALKPPIPKGFPADCPEKRNFFSVFAGQGGEVGAHMVNMRAVNFPDWLSVLESDSELPRPERKAMRVTIRWYLGYCKRQRSRADFGSARAFIDK